MKKLGFMDLYRLTRQKGDIVDESPYAIRRKSTGERFEGIMHHFDRMLSEEDRLRLDKFGNVRIYVRQAEYAPELKRTSVFVAETCFK